MSSSPEVSWCSKLVPSRLKRLRSAKIDPGCPELPDSDFLVLGPNRTLRILRPPPRGTGYYEAPRVTDRRESLNDNFFTRWARRPHPSDDCRCSFRCPSSSRNNNNGKIPSTEESINKEIARIRTSLCEAEVNGIDIDELERTVSINLANIENCADVADNNKKLISSRFERLCNGGDQADTVDERLDSLEDSVKRKIVKDLDSYISNLLDEILNDTIRALAESKKITTGSDQVDCALKNQSIGYINEGFVGSDVDPDVVVVEPEQQQQQPQNLEQSLIDIIDAKLGGTAIGKSLEDLTKEIDKSPVNSPSKSADEVKELPQNGISKSPVKYCKRKLVNKGRRQSGTSRNVISLRVNRTVSVIREKIATSLGKSCSNRNKSRLRNGGPVMLKKDHTNGGLKKSQLEMDDYRRRFPVPNGGEVDDATVLRSKNRKPYVVFLHGFGSCAEVFQAQLKYFANLGYPCLAPDMLGHGASSAPGRAKNYHFLKLLRDIEEILIYYVFRAGLKLVLVGHNYGCSFATALAAKHHSRVQQLILISGGGPTPLAPPSYEGAGHCCLRASLAPFMVCGLHRAVLYSARGRQHPYCGDEPEDQRPSHMRLVLKGMTWPESDYIFHRRICLPTLLVHGLRDKKVSLVQECQMERTMIKAFLEAIPSAGHIPMTDCPDQLNHMIHCFIDLWKNKK